MKHSSSYYPLPNLRYNFSIRILYLMLLTFIGMIAAMISMALILNNGISAMTLRIATVMQDILLFIFPAICVALVVSKLPARLLCTDSLPTSYITFLALLTLTFSMPLMNMIVAWNESLTLPQPLAGIEDWMRQAEDAAQQQIGILLGGSAKIDLILNILIVGILAGLSEELFFRGALQRLLSSGRLGHHGAIWVTAFIFSVFHMQFFGFFPRMLLGAFFGYLLYWSGSIWLPVLMHVINNSIVVYSSWKTTIAPDDISTDINTWGGDSVMMVLCSIVLTGVAIYILNNIRKNRNNVTQQ